MALLIPLLTIIIVAGIGAVWYVYENYTKKKTAHSGSIKTSINISKDTGTDQEKASKIIEDAVEKARQTLLNTEYFKKDLSDQVEKSLMEVEENTSRLLEAESEALDQQYKDLLAQMQQAIVKARETLVNTEYIREDFVKELEGNLAKVGEELQQDLRRQSDEMSKQYGNMFEKIREDYLKYSENSVDSFEKVAEKKLSEFQKALEEKTMNSQGALDKTITEQSKQLEQELAQYRTQKMQAIDAQAASIIEQATEKILGKAISVSQHEQLVLEALEQAKKDGVFGSTS